MERGKEGRRKGGVRKDNSPQSEKDKYLIV